MRYPVESGIPLPPKSPGGKGGGSVRGAKWRYPWNDMQPGDSFFVPESSGETAARLSAASGKAAARLGHKYALRTVDGGRGWRIWRIE